MPWMICFPVDEVDGCFVVSLIVRFGVWITQELGCFLYFFFVMKLRLSCDDLRNLKLDI